MRISETFRKAAANILNNQAAQLTISLIPPLAAILTAQHYFSNLDPFVLSEMMTPLKTMMDEAPYIAMPLYGSGFLAMGLSFAASALGIAEGTEYLMKKAAKKLDPKPEM